MTIYDPSSNLVANTASDVKQRRADTATSNRNLSTCAAVRRHTHRRPPSNAHGVLDALAPDVAARLRDEGVPQADVRAVARQLEHLVSIVTASGPDEVYMQLHPWVHELLRRYRDKLPSIFMTTRGKVDAR